MDYKGPIEAALSSDLRGEPYNFSLWDIHTGTQLVVFKGNKANPIPKCMQFIDNNYFVTAVDNVVQVWSIYNRKSQDQKLFLPGRPSVLHVSPCGNFLIAGISEMIYIWQIKSGNLLSHTQRHYQNVSVLKTNHDGTFLISGGEDGMVLVWSFADLISNTHNTGSLNLSETRRDTGINEPRHTWQHHNAQVTDIHITNGHRCVTASVDMTINIYSYVDGKRLHYISFPSPIWSAIMNKNETMIFLGGQDGNIYQVDTSDISVSVLNSGDPNEKAPKIISGHTGKVLYLLISMDGSKLISASVDSSCKVWDIQQKKMLQDIKHQGSLANLTTVLVPDSFALTTMTQTNTKPPLSIKPLKRQLYRPPKDGTIMSSDLFEEASTTIVNIKNKIEPPSYLGLVESKLSVMESFGRFDVTKLDKNKWADVFQNGVQNDGPETTKLRSQLRDLYLLSAEKLFKDAAVELLSSYKPLVDEIIATNGLPEMKRVVKGSKKKKRKAVDSVKVKKVKTL